MLPTLPPLTYGQVKANRAAVDGLTAKAADVFEATENAATFLAVAGVTPEALDGEAPADIQAAALALFQVTFSRPEATAKVPTNP
jgi:predicted RNA-binding Zn ribbon-like protein